jgi:TatD DNase family protein
MEIIDTHAHLDMPEFDQDREETIKRAVDNGIFTMITIGINPKSNLEAVRLAEKYACVYAGIGIHPQDAGEVKREDIDRIYELAGNPRVVGIGETGLDFYRNRAPHEDQLKALSWQLETAREVGLPVIIHCRQAHETILPLLERWSAAFTLPPDRPKGVLHCCNVDLQTAEKYLEMGFFLSLGAYIGYPSSAALRETIKSLPIERIVLETDCPFLPPQKLRGKRNEPSYTLSTLEVLAGTKGMSTGETARQTTANAFRLFPKMTVPE